jgi:hypothetical protein
MRSYWSKIDNRQRFLIAYGGTAENFASLKDRAVFINDPNLRTRDHPREKQSYQAVMRAVVPWLREIDATHVYLAEYDEVPLVKDLGDLWLACAERENADVLGHRLCRVDNTGHPHFTHHVVDSGFNAWWREISRREDKEVVLSMLGCGSFWTREAFEAVASLEPPLKIYLELMLPTAAHHLGFRVRPWGVADDYMAPEIPKSEADFVSARAAGAWALHPVKNYWPCSQG